MSSAVVLTVVYLLRDFRENWRRVNHALLTDVKEFLSALSTFNPYPANVGEYGELLIMPANDRRDLTRRLKG